MPFRSLLGPRGQVILRTGSWSLIAKMTSAVNLFLSVPFVLHALGPIEFGAWATLASLIVFAGFLDFGLGNGTMNLVAAAHGRGDMDEIAAVIQEGRRTLWKIATALAVIIVIAAPLVPWYRLLGLPLVLAGNSRWAAIAVLFAIALAAPLNLANRVQLGLGQGNVAFRWQATAQFITLGLVILLARSGASFPILTAATVLTPLLGSLANTLSLSHNSAFAAPGTRRPDLAQRIRHEGLLFFVLQLAAALAYSADLPLISALRGPDDAGTYAIVQRLFSIIPLGLSLVWAPLWPIYRHALAAGHYAWVVHTLRRSVVMAMCFASVIGTMIIVGFNWIIRIWLHHVAHVPVQLLVGFVAWAVLDAGGTALATFLNAASVIRFQVITASIFAVACFGLKILVVAKTSIEWLPWVTVTTWTLTNALPLLCFRQRILNGIFMRDY